MPIRKEYLQAGFYGDDWHAKRLDAIERAGNRCQWCGKPGGRKVLVSIELPALWYDAESKYWRDGNGDSTRLRLNKIISRREIEVVLARAHLDHDPRNEAAENLPVLCQGCHLKYDRKIHAAHGRRTRAAKRKQLWLWEEVEHATWPPGLEPPKLALMAEARAAAEPPRKRLGPPPNHPWNKSLRSKNA